MFTDKEISNFQPLDKGYAKGSDGEHGLYIWIAPTGAKSFRWDYSFGGVSKTFSIGIYGKPGKGITLAEARTARDAAARLLRDGTDPSAHKKAAKAAQRASAEQREHTLQSVAEQYHQNIKGGFRSEKHAAQWISSLRTHVFPQLGLRPITLVTSEDLFNLLAPLRDQLPETGRRLYQRLEAIFDNARVVRKLVSSNPASDIRRALKRKRPPRDHFHALPFRYVPKLVTDLCAFQRAGETVRLALEFTILTAARSGEVRGATWDEIDWEAQTWTIPGDRMKAGEEHTVFLGPRALEILETAGQYSDRYLFPSPNSPDRPLSNMALAMLLRRMEYKAVTVHGFRTCFSSWARERGFDARPIEASLAHREAGVAGTYARQAAYVEARRQLAAEWERFVTTPPAEGANVISIRGRTHP